MAAKKAKKKAAKKALVKGAGGRPSNCGLSKAEKVQRIYTMIIDRSFGESRGARTKTLEKLAKEWDCAVSTVKNYSADAWMMVQMNTDVIKADILETCHEILHSDDNKDRLAAAGHLAKLVGANAAEKVEVSSPELSKERARAALMNPSPEMAELLKECGWMRREIVEG